MLSKHSQGWIADGVRFALAGGANTALTLVVYQLGVGFFGPSVAYILAWVCGLAIVYYVYPKHVFIGGRRDKATRIAVVANYVAAFVLGLVVVNAMSYWLEADRLAILVSLMVTTSYTFMSSRFIARGKSSAAQLGD